MQQWLIKHVEKKNEIHNFYMFKLVVKDGQSEDAPNRIARLKIASLSSLPSPSPTFLPQKTLGPFSPTSVSQNAQMLEQRLLIEQSLI